MKKIFTSLTALLLLCVGFSASAATLPTPRFIVPVKGAEVMTGIQIVWGPAGDYCPLEFVNNGTVMLDVSVPGFENPFSYRVIIQDNDPGEEEGGDAIGKKYDNTLLFQKFGYPDGWLGQIWQKRGNYVVHIPANTVYVTVDGEKIPNEEVDLTYFCQGKEFFDEGVTLFPATDMVDDLSGVVIRYTTSVDSDGFSSALRCETPTVPATVTINGGEPTTVYGNLSSANRSDPNQIAFDMTQFNNQTGIYELTLEEGVVYEDPLPWTDTKKNPKQTFTYYVGIDDPKSVYFEFTGEENAYQLVSMYNSLGLELPVEKATVNYPINFLSDTPVATFNTPIEYPITILNPEGLTLNKDYEVDYFEDMNADEEAVNVAYITFLNDQVYGKTFPVYVGEYSGDVPGTTGGPSVVPAPGNVANFTGGDVFITWEGCAVTLTEGFEDEITIVLNGEKVDADQWYWNFVDEDGEIIYGDNESGEPAKGICINAPFGWSEDGSPLVYEITVPEGMFTIVDAEGESTTNKELNLEYKGIIIVDDLTLDPARGSQLKSVKEINLEWDLYEATINTECKEQITYGANENIVGTASILNLGRGRFTIELDKEYATQGWMQIHIPEGFFNLVTDYGTVASPEVEISYQISLYVVVPNDYTTLDTAFDSFTVFADGIKLVGNVADIKAYDSYDNMGETYPLFANGKSVETVNSDELGQGITITFDKAYDEDGSVQVIIPAGTIEFGGSVYNEDIEVNYFITFPVEILPPTVTPEDNAKIDELVSVEISWNDSPLFTCWLWEDNGSEPFTLTINGGEAIDITENVEIVSEMNGNDYFPEPISSKLVIKFDNPYVEAGKYEIFVPADYVEIANYEYMPNEEMLITYIVGDYDGVSKFVDTEDGVWRVYDLNGVNVLTTGNADELQKLGRGVFIINGAKVILR